MDLFHTATANNPARNPTCRRLCRRPRTARADVDTYLVAGRPAAPGADDPDPHRRGRAARAELAAGRVGDARALGGRARRRRRGPRLRSHRSQQRLRCGGLTCEHPASRAQRHRDRAARDRRQDRCPLFGRARDARAPARRSPAGHRPSQRGTARRHLGGPCDRRRLRGRGAGVGRALRRRNRNQLLRPSALADLEPGRLVARHTAV